MGLGKAGNRLTFLTWVDFQATGLQLPMPELQRKPGGLCRAVWGVDAASYVLILADGCAHLSLSRGGRAERLLGSAAELAIGPGL